MEPISGRADLRRADLGEADLSGANLSEADLSGADLTGADLREADLRRADLGEADLREANLSGADLSRADLGEANLSGVKGLLSSIDYMVNNFNKNEQGYIVYKTFALYKAPRSEWKIEQGAVICETVNPTRTDDCGSGVNVATLDWLINEKCEIGDDNPIWKCLIRWEWLPGVVVPYNTDGKIRCEKVELIEIVEGI